MFNPATVQDYLSQLGMLAVSKRLIFWKQILNAAVGMLQQRVVALARGDVGASGSLVATGRLQEVSPNLVASSRATTLQTRD